MPIGIYTRGHFSLEEFFWERVSKSSKNNCWEWKGAKYITGYGEARKKLAHRVSWEIENGGIPVGFHVLHKCDNRLCVNPNHLYIGTDKENRKDAIDRKRYPGNSRSSRARLTETQVLNILHIAKPLLKIHSRESVARLLSESFPVSSFAIRDILSGKRWNHLQIEVRT